jgi:hypothetical protein
MSEPVIIFYKSNFCGVCERISSIWENAIASFRKIYPKIRIEIVIDEKYNGNLDFDKYPKGMQIFGGWAPKIILIPGKTWDAAMANLGPNNPIEIKEGVQVMNATWDDDTNKFVPMSKFEFNWNVAENFGLWLKKSIKHPDFVTAQNEGRVNVVKPKKAIRSILTNKIKTQEETIIDVCSMSFLERPYIA